MKVENDVVTKAWKAMEEVGGLRLKFEDNVIQVDGEQIQQEWKPT